MLEILQVNTSEHSSAMDITDLISRKVQESGIKSGLCVVSVTHTTAGIIINEGADPAVIEDVMQALEALVPWKAGFKHLEGNSAAHIRSILVGSSIHVIIDAARLVLGTWQRIFLLEFDGPRTRKIRIKIISG